MCLICSRYLGGRGRPQAAACWVMAERELWETHDSTEYLDWSQAKPASFPKLKPSTKTILLRLPETLLDRIKIEVNKRDMPYQSLIKAWLADDVNDSRRT